MTLKEAVARACREPSRLDALVWISHMKYLAVLLVTLFACAKPAKMPLGTTMLPPTSDYEVVLSKEPAEEVKCADEEGRFPTQAVVDYPDLPDGVLLHECTYAESLATKAREKRLTQEVDLWKKIRATEHKIIQRGERAYQQRIVDLENRPWWERAKFEIGVGVGIGITIFTLWATDRVQD